MPAANAPHREPKPRRAPIRTLGIILAALLIATTTVFVASSARAQTADVTLNEVVAANKSNVDEFGDTSDWIELQNNENSATDLSGWTIADSDGNGWTFPSVSIPARGHLLLRASGRDVTGAELHTSFSLKSAGETLLLAADDGALVDTMAFPKLADDQAWGHGASGGVGALVSATPGAPNTDLLPSQVNIITPAQTFVGSLTITLTGSAEAGESIRYTTDGSPVGSSSPVYNGPFTINQSTVVRAALVGNGLIGTEVNAGYTAIANDIAPFTSNLPIVLVHSTGAVQTTDQDAIVTIIEPDADGRAGVFEEPSYTGFAGLRIRGASSAGFTKKQYKFETWGDQLGNEVDVDLFGMGANSDWVLYAPGRHDRAMINNPLMYQLAKDIGVIAPDYRFVELYLEDNSTSTVGSGDYLGLYVLRENVKIDNDRVDITEHTSTSAGPDGGYIVRYDWYDTCCTTIEDHPQFGSKIAVDTPGSDDITSQQLQWIQNWWNDVQAASATSFEEADQYIDFDNFIDGWLLEILALDVDALRASHYMHKDADGQLQAGPLWDYDRSLGAADSRVDDLDEAKAWKPNGSSGHTYDSDIYGDLWELPEVQSRLRARWAELRQTTLSDSSLIALIDAMGASISEAYVREDARWGSTTGYGSRFGGLDGELSHMKQWVQTRTAWLDQQFISAINPPLVTNPSTITVAENEAVSVQVGAADPQAMVFTQTGLPLGLTLDESTGLISGKVAYGDGGDYPVTVVVTDSSGAATTIDFMVSVTSPVHGSPVILLNEYNAVAPGLTLDADGDDSRLGLVAGNGGDWFELVILKDHLDIRRWNLDVWYRSDDQVIQTARLILANDPLLADLRAGTIITVAESVPDDLSYDPVNGDWTLNLQANHAQDGAMFENQTNFDTNHLKWRLVIRDRSNRVRGQIAGETGPWDDANGGLSKDEVLALATDPTPGADPATDWADATTSTFGEPNIVGDTVQSFAALRPEIVTLGDVSCDGANTISDALMIAQYTVGQRSDAGQCPMSSPGTQIRLDAGDVNNSGTVTITDAIVIARCTVGIPNDLCPE